MHNQITDAHIRNVSVMDSYVTANARCTINHLELDAECSVDMRPDGSDEGTPDITDAEIELATRQAISGVIGKLQAVVNGRFARADIKFEETAAGKARSAVVGEKAAARPLAACETVLPPGLGPVELHAVIEAFPANHVTVSPPRVEIVILRKGEDATFTYVDSVVVANLEVTDVDGTVCTVPVDPFSPSSNDQIVAWLTRDAIVGKGEKAKIVQVYVDTGWPREEATRFADILVKYWGMKVTTGRMSDFPTAPGDGRHWTERSDVRLEDLPAGYSLPLPQRFNDFDGKLKYHAGSTKVRRSISDKGVGWMIGRGVMSLEMAINTPVSELRIQVQRVIRATVTNSEGDPEELWANRYKPVYRRLFEDMGVSIPACLSMPHLEAKIRKLVDGRTTWTRQLKCEAGWHIGGEFLSLERVLQLPERSFESCLHGIIAART